MEISSICRELPEVGLMEEDPNNSLFNQWSMNSFDDHELSNMLPLAAATFGENLQLQHSFSNDHSNFPNTAMDRPFKQLKSTNSWESCKSSADHSDINIISNLHQLQQPAAFSPMDKASVLGDAIKYLKQLQERVKILEEKTRKRTMESAVVFVKKSQLIAEGDDFYSDENFNGPFHEPLPEIEARFCDKSVLIRIHCEKRKGVAEKIMSEIEKTHLTVVNSNVITFGTSALDITIVAQMEMEFCMTVKDLVKKLRLAFKSVLM
ncbi:hypothetical protein COLO4_17839 [Corchorus olitorius]|uniref:Plant bHLH transcription factor ACT-like domain-containing protein n=1 Tax=Corchorus olitorius TaxID=93759 RepID=A0A1R3JBG3_9ROSI|nr:hypothetical protein COLO4_17839 [Corchorus olitorius]